MIKILLLAILATIFMQDHKERRVWSFLFPLFIVFGGLLFFLESEPGYFVVTVLLNLLLVGIIVLLNFLYAKFVLKKSLLREALGPGDILFFVGLACAFPTVTFLVLFVFAIGFSLALHLLISNLDEHVSRAIPLAGNMAAFYSMVYLAHWAGLYSNLYFV